jgi:uncharacterized RDD family membrane protein YckC
MDTEPVLVESRDVPLQRNVTGRRIVAALLDLIPLAIVFVIMAFSFGEAGKTVGESGVTTYNVSLNGWPLVAYGLISFGYFMLCEAWAARTPGKSIMGLMVVSADGGRCDWKAVVLRNVLRVIDFLPVLYLVGLISVAATEKNQRLGDLAAGTLVVREA